MFKKVDKMLLLAVIIMSIFGIIMVYSASFIWASYRFNDPFKFVKSQAFFFIVGLFLINLFSKVNIDFFYKNANKILIISLIILILVLIPGIGKIRNGSRSWFGIGGFGIQPSEFAKIGLIIYVAKYLANNNRIIKDIKKGIFPLLLIIGVFFALIMLEPDFGTGMVFVLTLISMIFISGVKLSFFVKTSIFGLIGIILLVIIAPYRMLRIISFLNPWTDPLGSGYQIIQSLYAIGPGGLTGFGFLNSHQKQFYLPEPQTDFIFSIISEEFGFLGILIVTSFLAFIFYRIIKIALKEQDLFKKYLVFGLGSGIIIQSLLNISVVIGLLPVTGVTLPFLSYGGSSLLMSLISIGIILNISKSST